MGPAEFVDATSASLALSATGTPYVAYPDPAAGRRLSVRAYDGTDWILVGSAGFSAGKSGREVLKLSATGTPYVAFLDSTVGLGAVVMKYDGSAWVLVGAAGFSAEQAGGLSLALDVTEEGTTPYVSYTGGANGSKLTVKKFDGTDWITVGTPGFTVTFYPPGVAAPTSLALDAATGTPYVAFVDGANAKKATVVAFNGASWEPVGSAGFTAGESSYLSLALASGGTPYLAFVDGANGSKATVMKLVGNSWELVGAAGFSSQKVDSISLALSASGTPFVAYAAYDEFGVLAGTSVMAFDGTKWGAVGAPGTPTVTLLVNLALDAPTAAHPYGRTYISFIERNDALGTSTLTCMAFI